MKFISLYLFVFLACNTDASKSNQVDLSGKPIQEYEFPYDLSDVEAVWLMDNELIEISGLSLNAKDSSIWSINDEKGRVYELDTRDGKIKSSKKFGPNADYEGIEWANDRLYIVKSNGNIFETGSDEEESKFYKTDLSMANDVEGLAYSAQNNSLILACKASPAIKDHPKKKNTKGFYRFDLLNKVLIDELFFEIHDSMLIQHIEEHTERQFLGASALKKMKERCKSFSPSAIAVHPFDGSYYILSSVGKLLVVFDFNKGVQHVEFLNKNVHYQPEGICFDKEGKLFIANEGKSLKAKVHIYKPKARS